MQRQDLPSIHQHAFQVTHNNAAGEPREYYRFALFPINPTAKYSIKDNKLTFRSVHENRILLEGSMDMEQFIQNSFNVHAIIATDHPKLLSTARARLLNIPHNKSESLIVDIEKNYYLQNATAIQKDYQQPNYDEHFVPKTRVRYDEGFFTSTFNMNHDLPKAVDPVYSQVILNKISNPGLLMTTNLVSAMPDEHPNPLAQDGAPRMEVAQYPRNDDHEDLGADVILADQTPTSSIAYRRTVKGESEWCSNVEDVNRKSYLGLTKELKEDKGNAAQISKLFSDYADKGTGFSALIHFHLFRHTQTIQKAREIAHELKRETFNETTNIDLAKFLLEKFDSLKESGFIVNPEGSFARRMNYAILQLTSGLCQNIEEFRSQQEQADAVIFRPF